MDAHLHDLPDIPETRASRLRTLFMLLYRDKVALLSAVVLVVVIICALFGSFFVDKSPFTMNLLQRNAPPFDPSKGWLFILGADTLGRSILGRMIVATQNTAMISVLAVACSMTIGSILGLIAGFQGGIVGSLIMRVADVLMSFPSLLMAMIILYTLEPNVLNVVIVLALTRIPVYLRTVRAEVLEARQRMFVTASRVLGAGAPWLIFKHVLPVVLPTLLTLATLELSAMMLAESGLSFLGLGIQPPDITWGAMVAEGRSYLATAWWLSFWPGLAIIITTLSLNLLSNWLRLVLDPQQRWRLEQQGTDKRGLETGAGNV